MKKYRETSQTKTYLTSRNALSQSVIKLSELHDYTLGKHSFGIQENNIESGFDIFGKIAVDVDELRLKTQHLDSVIFVDLVARCFQNRWSKALVSYQLPNENSESDIYSKEFKISVRPEKLFEQLDLKDSFYIPIESFLQRIDIVILVRLGQRIHSGNALIANRTFQILEKKRFRITKKSSGKGFNTKFESFSKLGYPDKALWYIDFKNFEDPPEDAVSIYLNKDIKKLNILLDDSSKSNEQLKIGREIMLKTIVFDVFFHVISKFIDQEGGGIDVWEHSEESSSLGAILANQLNKLFTDKSLNEVVKEFKARPERFRSELQVLCDYSNSLKDVKLK